MRNRLLVKAAIFDSHVKGMDGLIARGIPGLADRSDVINEALDGYLTEVNLSLDRAASEEKNSPSVFLDSGSAVRYVAVDETAGILRPPNTASLIADGIAVVEAGPLFFHNRDYTSLWAAISIADQTQERPLPLDAVLKETTQRAWRFAEGLRHFNAADLRPTVLFPTNREKRDAAEAAFRTFAIGSCSRDGKMISCAGPLFVWGICQVKLLDGALVVGVTPAGLDLLQKLTGLNARMPHDQSFAMTFFAFLQANAPEDWWGFQTICRLVQDKPTREQLLSGFSKAAQQKRYKWTAHQVANYVSGYISRAREWGLVATKQIVGRYELTSFGESNAAQMKTGAA
jgi:hypothetical protein